jgi:hypothetical protein
VCFQIQIIPLRIDDGVALIAKALEGILRGLCLRVVGLCRLNQVDP